MRRSELERIERVMEGLRRDAEKWNSNEDDIEYSRGMACGTWRAVALIGSEALYHKDVVIEERW